MTKRRGGAGPGDAGPAGINIPTPIVRVAPIELIDCYLITEDELELLAGGTAGSLYLNLALALLPVALTLLVTLQTATLPSVRLYLGYLVAFWLVFVQGMAFLLLWWRSHASTRRLVVEIKARMPASPVIEEVPTEPGAPS